MAALMLNFSVTDKDTGTAPYQAQWEEGVAARILAATEGLNKTWNSS